jgi:hypothetical protein
MQCFGGTILQIAVAQLVLLPNVHRLSFPIFYIPVLMTHKQTDTPLLASPTITPASVSAGVHFSHYCGAGRSVNTV